MRVISFKSYEEYREFMFQKFIHKAKRNGANFESTEFQERLDERMKRVEEFWNERECEKQIADRGSATLSVHRGMFKEDQRKVSKDLDNAKLTESIHVRLDANTYDKLLTFCEKHNMDISQAVRFLIQNS
ncbi:hypothetical protein [Priestia flexa]|uniref:hypothetical protein n=1 Tax=Priestia flexa TaxID=86664 RepID=UPI001B329908|nr:hypothetical protein [Priestia flexa]